MWWGRVLVCVRLRWEGPGEAPNHRVTLFQVFSFYIILELLIETDGLLKTIPLFIWRDSFTF